MILSERRWLVLCSIVCNDTVKQSVSSALLAERVIAGLSNLHIMMVGNPPSVPGAVTCPTTESRFTLGYTRYETSVIMYIELSAPIDSLEISNVVSDAWNNTSTIRPVDTFDRCPPGRVFEQGTRDATVRWRASAGQNISFVRALLPFDEEYFQVRTVASPIVDNRHIPVVENRGVLASLTTSNVTDSNVPNQIGNSMSDVPTVGDVANAANAAGVAVSRTVSETIGGSLGMTGSDVRTFGYISLAILGALVAVKVLKEVRGI